MSNRIELCLLILSNCMVVFGNALEIFFANNKNKYIGKYLIISGYIIASIPDFNTIISNLLYCNDSQTIRNVNTNYYFLIANIFSIMGEYQELKFARDLNSIDASVWANQTNVGIVMRIRGISAIFRPRSDGSRLHSWAVSKCWTATTERYCSNWTSLRAYRSSNSISGTAKCTNNQHYIFVQ